MKLNFSTVVFAKDVKSFQLGIVIINFFDVKVLELELYVTPLITNISFMIKYNEINKYINML
jgi:hypothetical protein